MFKHRLLFIIRNIRQTCEMYYPFRCVWCMVSINEYMVPNPNDRCSRALIDRTPGIWRCDKVHFGTFDSIIIINFNVPFLAFLLSTLNFSMIIIMMMIILIEDVQFFWKLWPPKSLDLKLTGNCVPSLMYIVVFCNVNDEISGALCSNTNIKWPKCQIN